MAAADIILAGVSLHPNFSLVLLGRKSRLLREARQLLFFVQALIKCAKRGRDVRILMLAGNNILFRKYPNCPRFLSWGIFGV